MTRLGLFSPVALVAMAMACGSNQSTADFGDGGGGGDDGGSGGDSTSSQGPTCPPCTMVSDCSTGSLCADLGGVKSCAAQCSGSQPCPSGYSCTTAITTGGSAENVCAPQMACKAATMDGGGTTPGPDGSTVVTDGGPVTGTIGANGGTLSRLFFAVCGDTRPPNEDEVSDYPTAIITKIFQDIEAFKPHPPFVVSTGDYQYSSTSDTSAASAQVGIYMMARANYTGAFFPAMGNHECTGADNSNCVPGTSSANTANYNEFMSQMLAPISKTLPYYVINVNATDGSWTSKFVVVAPNAWSSTQQSWLSSTLAQTTTYTFIIRHEPSDDASTNPAGVAASDTIVNQHPYTLMINGHSHTWGHYSDTPQVVILGNGGAPPDGTKMGYGYGIFSQQSDGSIIGDEYDYMTGAADPEFHFQISADGKLM